MGQGWQTLYCGNDIEIDGSKSRYGVLGEGKTRFHIVRMGKQTHAEHYSVLTDETDVYRSDARCCRYGGGAASVEVITLSPH